MIKKISIIGFSLIIIGLFSLGAKSCINRSGNKIKTGSSDYNTFMINAPSNLSTTAVSYSQINLSWQDNSNNEDGFEIWSSTDGGGNYALLSTFNSDTTAYSDPGISWSTTYYYRVRGFNTIGDRSEWSNTAIAVIPSILQSLVWSSVAAGESHTIALNTDGTVWAWGRNDNWWQLGIGDTSVTFRTSPTLIASNFNYQPFAGVTAIFAGPNHNLVLKTDGTLWGWGENGAGQLGTGDTATTEAPLQIGTELDWATVSTGGRHTIGLKSAGTLWAWGNNRYFQLGDESGEDRTTPMQIGTGSDWVSVSAGWRHSIGLKSAGTLWGWGYNYFGQLGDGSMADKYIPTRIGTNTDWFAQPVTSTGTNLSPPVVAGYLHTIGIKSSGTLWAWGFNNSGQLGLGDSGSGTDRKTPTQIGTESDWIKKGMAAGTDHTVGLRGVGLPDSQSGTLWVWGFNYFGQLGLGDSGPGTNRNTPTKIGTESDWVSVTAGYWHTIGLKSNGMLWAWGRNDYGQLGLRDTVDRNIPYPLGSPLQPLFLTCIAIGLSQIKLNWQDNSNDDTGFVIERSTDGISYTLLSTLNSNPAGGWTSYLDTGLNPANTYYYRVYAYNSLGNSLYVNVSANFNQVAPSSLIAAPLNLSEIVLTWADNSNDEIGFIIERGITNTTYSPIATIGNNTVSYLDMGLNPANTYYYRVYAYNSLGNSPYSNSVSTDFNQFAPSSLTAAPLSLSEIVLTWTDNSIDEIGFKVERKLNSDGTYQEITTVGPAQGGVVSWLDTSISSGIHYYRVRAWNAFGNSLYSNEAYTSVLCDWSNIANTFGSYSIAQKIDGTLWSWGYNYYGDLGLGDTIFRLTPNQIGTDTTWSIFSGGASHTIALKKNLTIWSWGYNNTGQLGLGNSGVGTEKTSPVQIGTESNWVSVTAGQYYAFGIKTGGTIWAWGHNTYGQLGLGDTNNRNTPTQVGTFSDWSALAAGSAHSLGIKTDGTLWAWGYNAFGRLGDGTTIQRTTPKQIGIDSDWVSSAAGSTHSLGIKSNGTLWIWGYNFYGQLGLGNSGGGTDRYTPTQIGPETNWSKVVASTSYSIGLTNNNTILIWGRNNTGQLGLGDTDNRNTPVQIGIYTDWSKIAAGYAHSLALRNNGTLWSWGFNNSGQLGLGDSGTGTDRNTPALVGE